MVSVDDQERGSGVLRAEEARLPPKCGLVNEQDCKTASFEA